MRLAALIVVMAGGDCTSPDCTSGKCDSGGTGTGGTSTGDSVPVVVDHTDPSGALQSASGTVSLDLESNEVLFHGIALDEPAVMVIDDIAASLITRYPLGTLVEIRAIDVLAEPIDLDSNGTGRLAAGVPVWLEVTLTEPTERPVEAWVEATLPWDLVVTATERGVTVAPWSDGLGGTFEVR